MAPTREVIWRDCSHRHKNRSSGICPRQAGIAATGMKTGGHWKFAGLECGAHFSASGFSGALHCSGSAKEQGSFLLEVIGATAPRKVEIEALMGSWDALSKAREEFLQNLCGGPRSWKFGKECSLPRLLARYRPPAASEKQGKLDILSNKPNLSELQDDERFKTMGRRSQVSASEQNQVLFEGPFTVESSFTVDSSPIYSNASASLLESLVSTEVKSGSAVSKEELGRATWTFLHTLAAQFPEHPTKQQQRDAMDLMGILSRIYPCKECADHFKDVLKVHAVEAKSGKQLAQWMCRAHNVVNRSLGKAQFPCHRVDFRWGALGCNEGACDLHGRLYR